MTKLLRLLLLLVATPLAAQDIAITNVNVIPMDRERVLAGQDVLIRNGRVRAFGARGTVRIPLNAHRIDGRGRYLLPGLADMHVHVRIRSDLDAYIAHGVTTVANMGSANGAELRKWREEIRGGRAVGPQMFLGYFVDGPGAPNGVGTVDSARMAVVRADEVGYDFIKVYNALTAEQFDAIIAEAKARKLAVVGHGVRSVGLERAFAAGQSLVVHAEEFLYTELRRRTDGENVPRVIAFTREHGAYVIPNLSAYNAIAEQWGKPEVVERFLAEPEAEFLAVSWAERWRDRDYVRRSGSIANTNAFLKRFTLDLQQAGVPLLTGTDSPIIPGMFPGASLHEDLRLLVAAGLTPFEALTAATRNAGEYAVKYLHAPVPFGTITVGARADLLLVNANPLANIANLQKISGVIAGGHWLDRDALDRHRRAARESIASDSR
jgi:hypothetical protein